MKKITMLFVFCLVLFTACKKDDGPTPADAFVGNYNVVETYTPSGGVAQNYEFEMSIIRLSDNEVQIKKISDIDIISANASANTLTFTDKTILNDGNQFKVTGTATLSGTNLQMNYTFRNTSGVIVATATATATKK